MDDAVATPVGGIFDRFHILTHAMALVAAVKAKDVAAIRVAVQNLANDFGYGMDAKELDDVVQYVLAGNAGGIVYESGDALMKFAVAHMGFVPVAPLPDGTPGIRVMASGPAPKAIAALVAALEDAQCSADAS